MSVFPVGSGGAATTRDGVRLAGELLLGKRCAADLPAADQERRFEALLRGKCVLFQADPAGGPSKLRFPELASELLAKRIEAERTRCDVQRQALLEVQTLLGAVDIPILLFKSAGPYPYTSSNIDALVPEGTLGRAVQQLEVNGFREMTHYWEPNKRLLRRFQGRESALELHLHEKVSWIVLAFLEPDLLWSGARSGADPQLQQPAPEHLVAALLAHSVYESNRVSLGDVEKIRGAFANPAFDWSEVVACATRRAWLPGLALSRYWHAAAERAVFGDSLLDAPELRQGLPPVARRARAAVDRAVARGDWPVRLGKPRLKTYFFRKLVLDNRRSAREKLWDLFGVASQIVPGRLGLRARPASFVCLCGIDGSGKSSHAAATLAALAECELPAQAVWMRGGYAPATERLKQLLRKSSQRVPQVGDLSSKERVYRVGALRWLWAWWVVGEQVVQAFLKVRWARWRGRSVVAERFVPDTLVDLAQRFGDPQFARSAPARWLARLTPSPDLILLLDLPGETAFARKSDDWSAAVLEERRQLYRGVLADHPRVAVLDATRPLAALEHETVDRVLQLVLGRIAQQNPLAHQRRDAWE